MKLYLTLILLLPLLGGAVNALVGRQLPRRVCETLACAVVCCAFICSLLAFVAYRGPLRVELVSWLAAFDLTAAVALYLDPLSLLLCVMITFVCGVIHLYAVGYMAEEGDYARFFALLNLFVFAMLTLVLAENLPLLYLGWEGVGFCSYALIGYWYKDERNATAGRKAFIVTRIGDVAFGIAIVWMFQLFSTLSIVEINRMGSPLPASVITTLGLLLLMGAAGKSAQIPLMVWLPDAMAGPTPVSALIHAATMVTAGVYLLARMLPLIVGSQVALAAIAVTGGLTAFYGASCAMAQRDLKRVLAYSTISQIGFMVLGVGCGAVTAATFHLLEHAFFKALLFLAAGCVITSFHHEQDIFRMGGARCFLPLTFWSFMAGAACLAGIPPSGGFFSKDAILSAVWNEGGALYGGLYLLGLLTALMTAVYTFRLVYLVFGGDISNKIPQLSSFGGGGIYQTGPGQSLLPPPLQKRELATPHASKIPKIMEATLIPLSIIGLFGGLINLPSYLGGGWLDGFLSPLAGVKKAEASHSLEPVLQGIAGAVAFAGFFIAHLRYGGARRQERLKAAAFPPTPLTAFLLRGWYLDDLYCYLFIRPYERIARFLWNRFDEGVIDDSLDRLAALFSRIGELLGQWTTGRVSVYLLSFAVGLTLLLGYLTWGIYKS